MAVMSNPAGSGQPPEGYLLEQARKRLNVSQNEAGQRAGVSGTRWRQVVNEQASEMTSARGVRTIARMAAVVGVTAEQFAEIGREDVAEALREPEEEPTVAQLAAQLAEEKQRRMDLEQRFEEYLRQQGEEQQRRRPSG